MPRAGQLTLFLRDFEGDVARYLEITNFRDPGEYLPDLNVSGKMDMAGLLSDSIKHPAYSEPGASTYSSASPRRRKLHRWALFAAAVWMLIGTAIVTAGVIRLQLGEVLEEENLASGVSLAILALSAIACAVYGIIQVLGWWLLRD